VRLARCLRFPYGGNRGERDKPAPEGSDMNDGKKRMSWPTMLVLHLLVFGICFVGAKLMLGR